FQTWSFQCDLPAVLEFASVLSHEWPTSPAYLLQFKARSNLGAVRLPVTITIQTSHHLDENVQYRITEAKDANDVIIPPETLELRLQTLPDRRGYWLDTGQLPAPPS
ncbi:MAG: virulence factor SrfB, partial [Pseudomonadota bacterium]